MKHLLKMIIVKRNDGTRAAVIHSRLVSSANMLKLFEYSKGH